MDGVAHRRPQSRLLVVTELIEHLAKLLRYLPGGDKTPKILEISRIRISLGIAKRHVTKMG